MPKLSRGSARNIAVPKAKTGQIVKGRTDNAEELIMGFTLLTLLNCCRVSRCGNGSVSQNSLCSFNLRNFLRRKPKLHGAKNALDLLGAAGADNRAGHRRMA